MEHTMNVLKNCKVTSWLSSLALCGIAELKFVRDMMYSVVKRRTASGQLGPLVERKSGDLKDIYDLYLFGVPPEEHDKSGHKIS